MKILHKDWHREIKIEENTISTLVFENKKSYRHYLEELKSMELGNEGNFILLDSNKEVNFSKSVYLVSDFFNLDVSNKKIVTKVYEELSSITNENYMQLMEVKSKVLLFFEQLIQNSKYQISKKDDIDIINLLKLGGFHIDIEGDFLEKLSKFFEILVEICGIKIIITVGLQAILTEEELINFYKNIMLKKIMLINMESEYRYSNKLEFEKVYIFDKDDCEI